MELLNYYFQITIPICLLLYIFKGRSRSTTLFLIIGLTTCLFCGEVSGILLKTIDCSESFFVANITPIVEELLKAFPILLYIFLFEPDMQNILEKALSVGIGFAILENVFTMHYGQTEFALAFIIIRACSGGLFHGFNTMIVGYGLSFIKKNRKLFVTGTVTMLSIAITLHSVYNNLIQTKYYYLCLLIALALSVSVVLIEVKNNKGNNKLITMKGDE